MVRLILEAVKEWVEELLETFEATRMGYVTPQMYGAKADGTTDDTAAVHTALSKGKPVFFPSGHYRVLNVTIPSNAVLYGQGESTILEIINPASDTAVLRVGNINSLGRSNITISDMTLRGSETVGSADGGVALLDIWGGKYISVRNVIFQNNLYGATRLMRGSSYVSYDNCRFEACDIGVMAIGTLASSYVTVRSCFFTSFSSYNSYVNDHSEQISVYPQVVGGVTRGWVVEDCIFEYKATNVICLHEKVLQKESAAVEALEDKTLVEDCTIRNITVRGCMGAVTMECARNITIDGLHVEKVDTFPSGLSFSSMDKAIEIKSYSTHVTAKNIFIDEPNLAQAIKTIGNCNNCVLSGIRMHTVKPNPISLEGTNHKIYDCIVTASGSADTNVLLQNLSNSYIDIECASTSTKKVVYKLNTNVENNKIIIENGAKNTINRDTHADHKTVVDTNTYITAADNKYVHNTGIFSQINKEYVANEIRASITSVSEWESNMTTRDSFYLLENGHEFRFRFVWYNSGVSGNRDFSFPSTGNIVPIATPFRLSQDYDVLCYFKQINGKYVEIKREFEYKESVSTDALETRYNVLQHGLSNDGVTDNTTAFNNLLNKAKTGSVIYFPVGKYVFNSPITINKNVSIVGETRFFKKYLASADTMPESMLVYNGNANTTFMTKGAQAYHVSVTGISFHADSYDITVSDEAFSTLPYHTLKETVTENKGGINGFDAANTNTNLNISDCIFRGFSGTALSIGVHTFIKNCAFVRNKVGVDVTGIDCWVQNSWFTLGDTAIHTGGIQNGTLCVSDTWIDQMRSHAIHSENATSFILRTENAWVDMIDGSAINVAALLQYSDIRGRYSRCGMMYAGLDDADRTNENIVMADVIHCKQLQLSNIDIQTQRRAIGQGEHSTAICPSRVISTDDKIIKTSVITDTDIDFNYIFDNVSTSGHVTREWVDGTIHAKDREASSKSSMLFDYNKVNVRNTTPVGVLQAPDKNYLAIDVSKGSIYRSTAGANANSWELILSRTIQMPSSSELATAESNTPFITEMQTKLTDNDNYVVKLKDMVNDDNYYIGIANGKLVGFTEAQLNAALGG